MRFEREWSGLRAYAAERGVRLIGDVPIYPADASCDHLSHPELFRDGVVAGAPPDDLGPRGSELGNPLFDWDAVAAEGYRWWIERLRRTLSLVDVHAHRPLPRLRGLLDDPGRSGERDRGRLVARPRRCAVPGGRGRARRAAGDRRGPRGDHARCREIARRARLPGHGRAPLGVPGARRQPAPARRTTVSTRSVYTSTHDSDDAPRPPLSSRSRRGALGAVAPRARARVAAAGRSSRRRTCSASADDGDGMNRPVETDPAQLALAGSKEGPALRTSSPGASPRRAVEATGRSE